MISSSTTPKVISYNIKAFCKEIDSAGNPVYVIVKPDSTAAINSCFESVAAYIKQNGGSTQYGWIIWEESKQSFLEAEFHAVWVSSSGEMVDITPKVDGESIILFLPDTKRVYKRKLIENRRKLLVINDETLRWLWLGHRQYLFKEKHFKNGQVDMNAALKDKALWDRWENQAQCIKFSRNGQCPCGSGKRLKSCCGKRVR